MPQAGKGDFSRPNGRLKPPLLNISLLWSWWRNRCDEFLP